MYKKFIKRGLDIFLSSLALVVISPIFLLLAILVKIKLGSPVFFKQERSGRGEKKFSIIKFRTMTEKKDADGNYLPDELRFTKFGRFLRASSLDEIPELLNIVSGSMSIIGPRPLPPRYNEYYTEREKKRFDARMGLIPPEVLYENVQPTWEEQLEYEAEYAETVSFIKDVKILIAVFKGLFIRYDKDYGEYVRNSLDEERRSGKESTVNDSINTPA